jgi:hypothetical protein
MPKVRVDFRGSVLVEEFFKNQYSTDQRFVALNALAIGARELSSLSIPQSLVLPERTTFPSKKLPAFSTRNISGRRRVASFLFSWTISVQRL